MEFTQVASDYDALSHRQTKQMLDLSDGTTIQHWIDALVIPPVNPEWKQMKHAYYWTQLAEGNNIVTPILEQLELLETIVGTLDQLDYPVSHIRDLQQYHRQELIWAQEVLQQAKDLDF